MEKLYHSLVNRMNECGASPRNIQISRVGEVFMVGSFDCLQSQIITESVSVGMSNNLILALCKSLVERVERQAFKEGKKAGKKSCSTDRSDGFAGFPMTGYSPEVRCRDNAFYEAFERYVWARWWDDLNIGFNSNQVELNDLPLSSRSMVSELNRIIPIEKIIKVCPWTHFDQGSLSIFFAYLRDGGVVSGGAAGSYDVREETSIRALSELVRHGLAVRKMKSEHLVPSSFYEKRLAFFGLSTAGKSSLERRLEMNGREKVIIPELIIDEKVSHALEDIVVVHRCYFKDQPPFVGGDLSRLCL